jgi:hypothetical protein
MIWTLATSKARFGVKTERVVGRDDFPKNEKFSRRHFQVMVNDEVCLVKDLGSRNGSYLNGTPMTPEKIYKLGQDDVLTAGDLKFVCHQGKPGLKSRTVLMASWLLITGALFGVMVHSPAMENFKIIGTLNVLWFLMILAAEVAGVGLACHIFFRSRYWRYRDASLHFLFTLIAAIFLNDAMAGFVSDRFKLAESISAAKIEYYCTTDFNAARCIDEINACPSCAQHMDEDERQAILGKIKPFIENVAAIAEAQNKTRTPARAPPVVTEDVE